MPSETSAEPNILSTNGSILVPDGDGAFRLAGPSVDAQLGVAGCAAKLAVLTQLANNTTLPASLRAACAAASDDAVEDMNTRLVGLARVHGEEVVERMLRMQAAAVAVELGRFLLARADEDANDLG